MTRPFFAALTPYVAAALAYIWGGYGSLAILLIGFLISYRLASHSSIVIGHPLLEQEPQLQEHVRS